MQPLFFSLIQIALGNREMLTRIPSAEEWEEAYELARKQGVAGVAFMGVLSYVEKQHKKCRNFSSTESMQDAETSVRRSQCRNLEPGTWNLELESCDDDEEFDESWLEAVNLPEELYYTWMQQAMDGEKKYKKQLKAAHHLDELLREKNLKALIFKGISLSLYYPMPQHRECGDIDIIAFDDKCKELDELMTSNGGELKNSVPKHSSTIFNNVTIENHRSFSWDFASDNKKAMNQQLLNSMKDATLIPGFTNIYAPSIEFDELFILEHAANHFRIEGINIRMVLDWMFIMQRAGNTIQWNKIKEYGLAEFGSIINSLANDWFDARIDSQFCQCNEEMKQRVMNDILCRTDWNISSSKGMKKLWNKCRRFISRRWTYPLTGQSLLETLWRTLIAHILEPGMIF